MSGFDILINKVLTTDVIRSELLKILGLSNDSNKIIVTGSMPESALPENYYLLVIIAPVEGEMLQQLEFYFESDFESRYLDITCNICDTFKCTALMSDQDINPYTRRQVFADGTTKRVLLDVSSLDENEEYIIKQG
jgi:hypothetical protein